MAPGPFRLPIHVLVTCEHGGNEIPEEYAPLFCNTGDVLKTHRGYDIGALELAQSLARALNAPLFFSTTSRLLIELNRSLDQPDLFSEWSGNLDANERLRLIEAYYAPYRHDVESHIRFWVQTHCVVHLSVHSFTPVLNGMHRATDIGLLFDPNRDFETTVCKPWKDQLQSDFVDAQIDFNRPYLGTDDGLTTSLRTRFHDNSYAGIEIEINQRHLIELNSARNYADRFVQATKRLFTSSTLF